MSDPARVLLCSFEPLPSPTGGSRRLSHYVQGLHETFQMVGLCSKTPDVPHIEKFHGIRLLRVPIGEGELPTQVNVFERAVRRQLESEEYDLVHFTDPFGGYAVCELKAKFGFKLIYEAQSLPSYELLHQAPAQGGDRKFLAMARRQELFCLSNADQVITGSNVTRHHVQALGVAPEKLKVVRAPIALSSLPLDLVGKPTGSPMRLLYLGSQARYQGLETLLKGVQLASREAPMGLLIVGPRDPERQARLEELVVELQLEGQVEIRPPVGDDELPAVLAASDVGVVPLDPVERNQMQGGPLSKASEYLAAGRPVIAADLPLTRELIPSDAGLFYRAGDVKHLAERLVALAREPEQRRARGERARAYAQERLDAPTVVGKVSELYQRLLRPSRRAAAPAPRAPAPAEVIARPAPSAFDDEVTEVTHKVAVEAPAPPETPLPSEIRPLPPPPRSRGSPAAASRGVRGGGTRAGRAHRPRRSCPAACDRPVAGARSARLVPARRGKLRAPPATDQFPRAGAPEDLTNSSRPDARLDRNVAFSGFRSLARISRFPHALTPGRIPPWTAAY